jgi:hypothetical protein
VFAGAQATHKPVVDATEEILLVVGNTDDSELWEAVKIIDDARIFELVSLIEDYDRAITIVLLEAIDQFIVRG